MHQLIRTFFADPAWLPGFAECETKADPDALLASPDNLANGVAASGRNGQAIQKIG